MSTQRVMWGALATQCSHIVTEDERTTLLTMELVSYQSLEPAAEGMEVDDWWRKVAEVTIGGERQFEVLGTLALALCTVCPSGSEVERDFSDMEATFADPKCNATGQDLLEAKMTVKGCVKVESSSCARCIDADIRKVDAIANGKEATRKQCTHCHCSFLEVDDDLLAQLRNCDPWHREEIRSKERKSENKKEALVLEEKKQKDKVDAKKDLAREISEMKRRYQDARVKALKEKKDVTKVKVPRKAVPVQKVETDKRKKEKLAFVFAIASPGNNNIDNDDDLNKVEKSKDVNTARNKIPRLSTVSLSNSTSVKKKLEDSTSAKKKLDDSSRAKKKLEDLSRAKKKLEDSTGAKRKLEDSTRVAVKPGQSQSPFQVPSAPKGRKIVSSK